MKIDFGDVPDIDVPVKLPARYSKLTWMQRRWVREEYIRRQKGKCMYCKESLDAPPPKRITSLSIRWEMFPPNFLEYDIHLQHDHYTDKTEGAVHAYCNAVLFQYEGR